MRYLPLNWQSVGHWEACLGPSFSCTLLQESHTFASVGFSSIVYFRLPSLSVSSVFKA